MKQGGRLKDRADAEAIRFALEGEEPEQAAPDEVGVARSASDRREAARGLGPDTAEPAPSATSPTVGRRCALTLLRRSRREEGERLAEQLDE
jgi:hypothetical protein